MGYNRVYQSYAGSGTNHAPPGGATWAQGRRVPASDGQAGAGERYVCEDAGMVGVVGPRRSVALS